MKPKGEVMKNIQEKEILSDWEKALSPFGISVPPEVVTILTEPEFVSLLCLENDYERPGLGSPFCLADSSNWADDIVDEDDPMYISEEDARRIFEIGGPSEFVVCLDARTNPPTYGILSDGVLELRDEPFVEFVREIFETRNFGPEQQSALNLLRERYPSHDVKPS